MVKENTLFMRALNFIMDMILMNILFALLSIPGLTFGLAATAMYKTAFRFWLGNDMDVFSSFWRAIQENWRQALLLSLIFLAFFAGAAVGAAQTAGAVGLPGQAVIWFLICLAAMIWMLGSWLFPMIALYHQAAARQCVNAVLLAIRHFPTTLFLTAINLVPIVIFFTADEQGLDLLLLGMITVIPSAQAIVSSWLLLRVFERYDPSVRPQRKLLVLPH